MQSAFAVVVLSVVGVACSSNRYVSKNGGAPMYDVRIVNNCSRYTGRLYIDDEWRNRHKIDVKARSVGTRPVTFKLPGGSHWFHVEFREMENIKVHEGTFTVRGPATFSMC